MTKENSDLLFTSYRSLFPATYGVDNIPLESYAFDVGDGWFNLLNELFTRMEMMKDGNGDYDFVITQVKEKFAGLRVYTSAGSDALYSLLDEYEYMSYTVCELCGSQGKVTGKYWLVTLCDKCLAKRESKINNLVKFWEEEDE